MKNKYLKRFMALKEDDLHDGNITDINITFQAEIEKGSTIKFVKTLEVPQELVCFVYKLNKKIDRKFYDTYLFTDAYKYNLKEPLDANNETHVVSILLLHNPGQDQDSMRTTDAPML